MFMIKPASKPPRNTRAKLIFPIGILREQSPECRKSKGAEGTVARSLRVRMARVKRKGSPLQSQRKSTRQSDGSRTASEGPATTRVLRGPPLRGLLWSLLWFLACVRGGRGSLRAFWRCGGRGVRGGGNRKIRAGSSGAGAGAWAGQPGRGRGSRGKRGLGWVAGAGPLSLWV